MKNILFIASEAVPFIKTGGLADVVGSLPKCFDKQYFDVRVMIPKYLCIKESFRNEMKYVNHFYMDYLGQNRYVGILEYEYEGVTFYFIDNESFSGVIVMTDLISRKNSPPWNLSLRCTGISPVCQSWQWMTSGLKPITGRDWTV